MACVILPSETARLVYGYLVKENLNDIALQFLESSPYLMDCCQIVKSGFQFNTKLMGKDLPELLQEYSVIHNLVNNKISHLCKNSLLYKRIKLRCESLPEIVELILFWKYKNLKGEGSLSNSEKVEKNPIDLEVNVNCERSNLKDVSEVKTCENTSVSNCSNKSNISNIVPNNNNVPESYSKLNCEIYSVYNDIEKEDHRDQKTHTNEDEKKNKKSVLCLSVQTDQVIECLEKNETGNANNNIYTNNNSSHNNSNNNTNSNNEVDSGLSDPKFVMEVDSQCENMANHDLPSDSLVPNDEPNKFENPIKIVGIHAGTENKSQTLEVFSKPLEEESNINLENSSVVFVSSDVGNVSINQEQSQIIVIPFDYYKPQNGLQGDVNIESNKNVGLISGEVVSQEKNTVFEEETANVTSSTVAPLFREQSQSTDVDENIMTENDFLKNRQLLYNLEQELYKPDPLPQLQTQKNSNDDGTVHTIPAPVIVVSQPVPTKPLPNRYRAIRPKREKPVHLHPVVVVHPHLENNKDFTKTSFSKQSPILETKVRQKVSRRIKKKGAVTQKTKAKELSKSENFKDPINKTAVERKITNDEIEKTEINITLDKVTDARHTNEEKENLEKNESEKSETPVFVTKRNSKRLSLSTPRRKSHIRALEFETPPKTNEEKKKSKTSPKAKVDQVKVERKSVRNTLFKSPVLENSFKTPFLSQENKKLHPETPELLKSTNTVEPLNELIIPIATRSPNTKLSDAWENLTGVGCVIGQNSLSKTSPTKKMWDADLRCFILENSQESGPLEKRRIRKPTDKNQKDNRKSTKKKVIPSKRIKPTPVTVSPSKISLTAKRNTYSINGNEEGSPIRTLIDDLKIVTPFKDIETIRPAEETPLTKLLRENINTLDIDLSMINTPSFPPTPSIVITPDLDDAGMTGTNYYSPTKDCSKDKVLKITDYFKADPTKSNKKETKEMHEKVIDDLVSKAKEIIGLGKKTQEENTLNRRPSGKILSMVKIQMLTQCDKKLMENIPINEENAFSNSFTNQTIIGNVIEDTPAKKDLKIELEEKRKRALKKIKVVKENLNVLKSRVTKRSRKRKKSGNVTVSDRSKSDVSKESLEDKQPTDETDESIKKESGISHSTPYAKLQLSHSSKTDSDKNTNDKIVKDIREQFPSFQNNSEKYPELSEKSRKKLHYVENFLKLPEIVKHINEYNDTNPPDLFLKPSLRRFFFIFYKWLKHPHKRELNSSPETNAVLKEYLSLFDKVNLGLNHNNKRSKSNNNFVLVNGLSSAVASRNSDSKASLSDDDKKECKRKGSEKRKDEDIEDGVVSTLPLKKRKSTVQQVDSKISSAVEKSEKSDIKNINSEGVSQTQNFLQDIDVDRFLSQIHGQETSSTNMVSTEAVR